MRARFWLGFAASISMVLASGTAAAQPQSGPYPPIPYPPEGGFPPYPSYPPPNSSPPPTYVPPPGYVPPTYALGPRIAYVEGMVTPDGYHFEEGPRKDLVMSGAVVLGATYV